jgi:hypothetical protein
VSIITESDRNQAGLAALTNEESARGRAKGELGTFNMVSGDFWVMHAQLLRFVVAFSLFKVQAHTVRCAVVVWRLGRLRHTVRIHRR